MAQRYSIKTLGFSTDATELRPPPGEIWRVLMMIEVDATTGNIVLTDGTLTENYVNTDTRNQPLVTNEWYFTLVAQTADEGYVISIENVTFDRAERPVLFSGGG